MANDLANVAAIFGVSLPILFVFLIWSAVWKGVALWKPQKLKISDGCQKSFDF